MIDTKQITAAEARVLALADFIDQDLIDQDLLEKGMQNAFGAIRCAAKEGYRETVVHETFWGMRKTKPGKALENQDVWIMATNKLRELGYSVKKETVYGGRYGSAGLLVTHIQW